jgi:pimeloyl-ACP methyl ester carboxylesterase
VPLRRDAAGSRLGTCCTAQRSLGARSRGSPSKLPPQKKASDMARKFSADRLAAIARRSFPNAKSSASPITLGRVLGVTAGVLAATALANLALAREAERSHPPEGKFITIDGVRLHYIERGTGPVIVLLHGNGAMAGDFVLSGLFDLLAKDYRVIAFDRPGFGYSERPRRRIWTADAQAALFHEALLRLDVPRAVVVGHSWGTLVALALALRDQVRTAGLVLLSGYYYPGVRADAALLSWPAIPVLGDLLRYTISPILGRLMAPMVYRKLFAPAPVSARFENEFPLELAVRPSQIRASAAETALMIPGAASLADHYPELSIPVAIMAGRGDKIVSSDRQSGRLNAALPQTTLRDIPDAGHMLHHIVPEEVAAVIREIAAAALS